MTLATRGLDGLDFGSPSRIQPQGRITISESDVRHPDTEPLSVFEWIERERAAQTSAREWARSVVDPIRVLPEGWDSHGAMAIDPAAADLAVQLLAALRRIPGLATPQAAPSRDGGVSLEWHRTNLDLVVSIGPGHEPPSAYFLARGREWEIPDLREPSDGRFEAALDSLTTP